MRPQHVRLARTGPAFAWLVLALIPTVGGRGSRAMPAPAPDLFDGIYTRSQAIDATLKTIDARFTETTTSPLLTKPLVAEGTLTAARPSDVELTYTKPERKTITIRGSQLLFVWPDRHLRETRDIEATQKRIQRYFVAKSADELRRHFTIVASEDRARAGTYLIVMTPKRKQIEQGLTRLDLWLRKDTLLLDALRMHFPGDSTKLMEFRDVEVNKRLVGR